MSFLKDPEVQAAENLLRSYSRFLRSYKENLKQRVPANNSQNNEKLFSLKFGESTESIPVFELLESENKILNKILLVFFHLGKEAKRLQKGSEKIIQKLIIVQDEIETTENSDVTLEEATNNAIVKFSYALEDLLNMKFLIQNSIFLSVNVLDQFSALFTMEKYFQITPNSCFPSNLDDVAILFKNLMVLDAIFENLNYKTYLQLYGEFISSQEDQMDADVMRNLQNTLHELHLLLEGNIFQIGIDNLIALKGKIKEKSLKRLESFMLVYIKNLINAISMYDVNVSELTETDEIIKLNVTIVIYQQLFGNFDPKNLRFTTEINNKFCAITIYNILWNGNEFLKKNVPALFKSTLDVAKIQQNFMNQKVQTLGKDATVMYASQISLWIIQMQKESQLSNENITERTLKLRCEIFYQVLYFLFFFEYKIFIKIYRIDNIFHFLPGTRFRGSNWLHHQVNRQSSYEVWQNDAQAFGSNNLQAHRVFANPQKHFQGTFFIYHRLHWIRVSIPPIPRSQRCRRVQEESDDGSEKRKEI
jgi:WASH complex subunit 7, N-terminal